MDYVKLEGLKRLESLGLTVPPYLVIRYPKTEEVSRYLERVIDGKFIPGLDGDRVGVTVRVTLPGLRDIYERPRHGGLHLTRKNRVIKSVIDRFRTYGEQSVIIVQHTVDAAYSGTFVAQARPIIEAIPGDAPRLLEGRTDRLECWELQGQRWHKTRSLSEDSGDNLIPSSRLRTFRDLVDELPPSTYLEWSVSKKGKTFFYEYLEMVR